MSENKLTVTGRLCEKFDAQKISEKMTKREFVIETVEKYPQFVKLELVNDKCADIEPYAIGTNLEVSFNIRGNKWQGKYFNNLQAWKIVSIDSEPETYTATVRNDQPQPVSKMIPDASDDLPF